MLSATETAKIKTRKVKKKDEMAAEFNRNIAAITAFTNDMRVIRLHLISHYSIRKNASKLHFDVGFLGQIEILPFFIQFSTLNISYDRTKGEIVMKFKTEKPIILASGSPEGKNFLNTGRSI